MMIQPAAVAAIAAVQTAATFWVYYLTAFPSISGGDSGELAGVACAGGKY